jgi:apolipoprotein N-acyltransferase
MRKRFDRDARVETLGSRVVLFACAASAGAHAGLVPAHLQSEPLLGWAFLTAVVLLVSAAAGIATRPGDRGVASGVALLLAGLMLAYLATRTTGIPVLDPEREAVDMVGVATTTVEAIGLAFALWLIQPLDRLRRSTYRQEVSR